MRTAIALCVLLAPSFALAQTAHLEPLRRDPGDRIRAAIVRELDALGVGEGEDAIVRGRYRRGALSISIEVGGQRYEREVRARSRDALAHAAAREVRSLLPAITAHEAIAPVPPREEAQVAPEPIDAPAPSEDRRSAHPALRIYAGAQIYTRALSYRDDLFGRLAGYRIEPGFAGQAGFEWFPLRHFSRERWADVAIAGVARAMALDTSEGQSQSYATHAHAWEIDLHYSAPIDAHAIGAGLAVGHERFGLDASGPAQASDWVRAAPIPTVLYDYVRPFAQIEIYLLEGLSLGASFGWRFLLSSGDLSSWFPRNEGSGLDFGGFVSLRISEYFDVRVSAEHHRYFFALNPEPGDYYVAGGALDEWTSVSLDAAVRIPEAR